MGKASYWPSDALRSRVDAGGEAYASSCATWGWRVALDPSNARGGRSSFDSDYPVRGGSMTVSAKGPWDLPIQGYEVLQITLAFLVDVVAYGDGGATATIRFEGDFRFTEPGRESQFLDVSEQRWEDLTAVLSLRHDRVQSARVSESGQLVVEFASGRGLEAGPNQAYENWEVSGPGFQLIASPGGGVAVFDSDRT